ncbi:MAG: ATP-binding cassette domain-containing protein [Bdellovibrionaceae bacterium]|nr:ATP-binding cassette domain-containing protein [Bdellovibrionales bacterium]MCB9085850.1 ATP-binding cassette domain-containing protein [Pseudobdellovibrionaceae bacterium]
MIEVRDLTKNYGDRTAIDRLNFSVAKGEVIGFLGPNGAGKSTTMKIITGYMAPTSGVVTVAGFDVFESPIEVKKRIGYLPETPPVYMDMFVQDYLKYVARLRGVPTANLNSMVDAALEKTNLQDVRKRLIHNLSKGFRQRVGLAQALVSDPEILILDEPTVGLDPKQVAEMRKLIHSLKGQHTIVLSTHILPEVQANCERIIIINRGQIVAEDSLAGLSKRMSGGQKLVIRVRRPSGRLETGLSDVAGVQGVRSEGNIFQIDSDGNEDTTEAVANLVVAEGAGLLEMKSMNMDLEDIFIQLTADRDQVDTQGGAL